jgi:hypothetical protein
VATHQREITSQVSSVMPAAGSVSTAVPVAGRRVREVAVDQHVADARRQIRALRF